MKTTKDKIRMMRRAYDALEMLNNIKWTRYRDDLFAECRDEERRHRTGDFNESHTSDTISVYDAGKMFAVKRIAEYMNRSKLPAIADYLNIQRSCFTAAALVENYREQIAKAWAEFDLAELASLDYCEFVKVKAA